MEANKESFGAFLGIFSKLSIQQKMLLGGIIIVSLVILGSVLFLLNEPSYSVLYTNMAPEDASLVVEQLNSQKTPYKLEDNGQTIKVPKEKVHELRLSMAGKGIPSSGIIGYEIFDKNTMGMSEFMQKINFKRALEGEISRTIIQQNGIAAARVHIVFPEKSIFKEDQKEPTASVVLKLGAGYRVSKQNTKAIANLVASSVEGLRPNKVNIMDTEGKLLSSEEEDDGFGYANNKHYEIRSNIESYLANKAQSILDNVLGFGNSIVKVNVDLDLKQLNKTMTVYDPESQVAIGESSSKSESTGSNSRDSNAVTTETTTTNYEVNKTIEQVIDGAGNIKRITVAAVINGVTSADDPAATAQPRTDEELQKLEQIVRKAVGIDETRKDEISLVSIPFETPQFEEMPMEEGSPIQELEEYSNLIIILFAVLASLFLLKGLLKKLKSENIVIGTVGGYDDQSFNDVAQFAQPGGAGGGKMPPIMKKKKNLLNVGDIEDEITDEAAAKKMRQDKIINYVNKNPQEAAKLINSWLREDEY